MPRISRPRMSFGFLATALAGTLAVGLAVGLTGCETIEPADPQPRASRAPVIPLNVPQVMRGTVASETIVRGYRPVLVRGYGLVVGLKGTGSRDVPPSLRAHMLSEISRRGFGQESTGFGNLTPDAVLDSQDTAVVIVEGLMPPGAVGRNARRRERGSLFDVRVYADPRTGTTSLEGGRLYTAELRPVSGNAVLPPTGSHQARVLAEASGPVFINPFADPGTTNVDAVNRNIGRIMNGGEALDDLAITLRLATPSHARAELIQNAVNTRFPQERGQADPTARGESSEIIQVSVPPSYRDRSDDFVELLQHTSIRQSGAEAIATSVRRAVERDPGAAFAAAWRWQALGPRILPIIKPLYDHPEIQPRMAALKAGAALDDPHVIVPLIEMTRSDDTIVRRQSVDLLADMRLDPRIDNALRELLDDPDIDVRLAAYEAEVRRADPRIDRYVVSNKFVLDIVDSDHPMIYITQIGQPRIALFGRDLEVKRPLVFDAWSGRLMMQGSNEDPKAVEVYFRDDSGEAIIERTSARVEDLIRFLGHKTSIEAPAAGLDLSYSETVGAIYALWRDDSIPADFKAEQDRVRAAIQRSRERQEIEARPEFADDPLPTELAPADAVGLSEGTADP